MQLISKFIKRIRFLLCVIDIYSKYGLVIPLKDKKGVTIVNAFQKVLDDVNRKPNEIWLDKGSEFYNSSMTFWSEKNDIEIYSTHNEGKSVVAKRFIRILKIKDYKHITAVSKNAYIDKLNDKVNEYNNAYHRTIKMRSVDVKDNKYPNGHIFIESFHVESSLKFHRFRKSNLRRNYDINSTWKFLRGFDFQNRRNIDEFSAWISLYRFDVEST